MRKLLFGCTALAVVLALVLGLGALAQQPTAVELAFGEDAGNYTRTFALNAPAGAEGAQTQYALRHTYGWLTARDDGSFTYELDSADKAVQTARSNGKTLSETITARYLNSQGYAANYRVTLVLQPQAAPVKDGQLAVLNDGAATVVEGRFFPEEPELPAEKQPKLQAVINYWGEYRLENGQLFYTLYNWSRAVQTLKLDEVAHQTLPLRARTTDAAGKTEDSLTNVTITVRGANDVPTVESFTHALTLGGETGATGYVLTGSKPGDGWDKQHTLTWGAETAAYGTMTREADGHYSYTLDGTLDAVRDLAEGETLTETFTYTYKDKNGDEAAGAVTITVAWVDLEPTVKSFTLHVYEDDDRAEGDDDAACYTVSVANVLAESTLGNGSAANHDFSWLTVMTSPYGDVTANNTARTLRFTLNNRLPAVQMLYPGNDAEQKFWFRYVDVDGDEASGFVNVKIHGAGDAPEAGDVRGGLTEDSDTTTCSGNVKNSCLLGDGTAEQHWVDWDVEGYHDIDPPVEITADTLYGTLTVNPDGSYTYALENANTAVQALGAGETLTESFDFTIYDVNDAGSPATLMITIDGKNDVPTAPADPIVITLRENHIISVDGSLANVCTPGDGDPRIRYEWNESDLEGRPVWLYSEQSNVTGAYTFSIHPDIDVSTVFGTADTLDYTIRYTLIDGDADETEADQSSGSFKIVLERDKTPGLVSTTNLSKTISAYPASGTFGYAWSATSTDVKLGNGSFAEHSFAWSDASRESAATLNSFEGVTLTLHDDGTISYSASSAIVPGSGAEYIFFFTVTDADGDEETFSYLLLLQPSD